MSAYWDQNLAWSFVKKSFRRDVEKMMTTVLTQFGPRTVTANTTEELQLAALRKQNDVEQNIWENLRLAEAAAMKERKLPLSPE